MRPHPPHLINILTGGLATGIEPVLVGFPLTVSATMFTFAATPSLPSRAAALNVILVGNTFIALSEILGPF